MRANRGPLVLGALAGGAVVAVGLWATSKSQPSQQPGDLSGALEVPKPDPIVAPPGNEDALRAALAGVSAQLPGVQQSVELLAADWLVDPRAVAAVVERFRRTSTGYAAAAERTASVLALRLGRARDVLKGLAVADTVAEGLGKLPVVGQVIAGIYQIARPFVEAQAQATAAGNDLFASNWKPGGKPNFTGWIGTGSAGPGRGDYFIQDVPILSYGAPIMVVPFLEYSRQYEAQMLALLRLAVAKPRGVEVPMVEARVSGELYYAFNASGNNDTSDAEVAAGRVYAVPVWNPLDISPRGPRGFDPANPRGWVQAAKDEAYAAGWLDPTRSPYTGNL